MAKRMTEGQLKMVEMALEGNSYHISNLVYVDEIKAVAEETAAWVISKGNDGRCDVVRGTYMDGRWISIDAMLKSYGVERKPIMDVIAVIPDYVNNITRAERPKVTSRGISPEKITDEDNAVIKDKLTVYAQQVFNCDRPDANGRVYTKEAVANACSEWVDKVANDFNEAYDMTYNEVNSKLTTPGPVNNVTVQGSGVELEIITEDKEPGLVKRFLDDWVRLYNDEWCKRPKGEHQIVYPAWDEILTPEARKTLEEKLGGPLDSFNFYPMFNDSEESGDPCDITITLGYESKGAEELPPLDFKFDFNMPDDLDTAGANNEAEELVQRMKENIVIIAKCESEQEHRLVQINVDELKKEAKRLVLSTDKELKESGKPYTDEELKDKVCQYIVTKMWEQMPDVCRNHLVPVQAMKASRLEHHHDPVRIKVKKLDARAKMPVKKPGQEENFCYDIYAIDKKEIAPGTFEYRTGLAFEIEDHKLKEEYILDIDARPRSSVSETGLILCNCQGTIDDPYRGEVRVRYYQVKEGPEYKPYEPGDRVAQIKIGLTPRCEFIELGEGEELSETARGQGGFGSSGRQ